MKYIIFLSTLFFLCSCRTIHDTEHIYTHDTLIVHHTDTFIHTKALHVHDTTRQVEHHYITLNQAGDTIKEVHHYNDTERTIVLDSTDRYRAKTDSLQRLLNKEREKEKTVEKKPTFWAHLKNIAIDTLIILALLSTVMWMRKK